MRRWIPFLIVLAVLGLIGAVLGTRALRASRDPDRPANVEGDVAGCERNLAALGYRLEELFEANRHYPNQHDDKTTQDAEALRAALVPRFMAEMPKCPRAGFDTYSSGYHGMRDRFELRCTGGHPGLPEGFPRTEEAGLVSRKGGDVKYIPSKSVL